MLTISDFQILIKSCSIESRNDPSPKSEVVHETKFSLKISHSTHVCLAHSDRHQTCKSVMVSCEFNFKLEATLFLKDTSMLILYKHVRNVKFVLFTKTSYVYSYRGFYPLSYYIYRSHWDTCRLPRARGGLVFPETVKNTGVSTIEHVTISKSHA